LWRCWVATLSICGCAPATHPAPEPPDEQAASQEVLIIDALADHWGFATEEHDTMIWAALPVHACAAR
jgi:hypothetical protein